MSCFVTTLFDDGAWGPKGHGHPPKDLATVLGINLTRWEQTCYFAVNCLYIHGRRDEESKELSTELFMYQLIKRKDVQEPFLNIAIALRIFLILIVSNYSGESSYSKLKLIETRLRTTMEQERLVNLTFKSIRHTAWTTATSVVSTILQHENPRKCLDSLDYNDLWNVNTFGTWKL